MQPGEEESDAGAPGLRLRVTPNGVKSFRWAVREADKQRWITLGRWTPTARRGYLTIGEARLWLERLKEAHHAGELAKTEAELQAHLAPLQVADRALGKTVDEVAQEFWKVLDRQRKRGSAEATSDYRKHFALIADIPLSQLKRSDCRGVVQRAFDGGAKVRAGKVLALLKQLLDYAERITDDTFTNPAARLRASDFGVRANSRKRWLDENEIPAFWHALKVEAGEPETAAERRKMAAALRLLLLTAVRTGELRLAEWADVDLKAGRFTIPVKNQKLTLEQAGKADARNFVIPLTRSALALFKELRDLAGDSPWVLPSTTSKSGVYDDKSIGRFMRRLWVGEKKRNVRAHPSLAKLKPASPHDLRRTARSWLGRLGVAPHIAERCLNHRLGRLIETYDQHDYFDERRAALEKWDEEIAKLLG